MVVCSSVRVVVRGTATAALCPTRSDGIAGPHDLVDSLSVAPCPPVDRLREREAT